MIGITEASIGFLLLIAMLGVIVLSKKHATEEPAK